MNPVAGVLVLGGAMPGAVVAAVGLLRFSTPYARLHAAGKASPISFLLVAAGCGIELGASGALQLTIAATAIVITMPVATHLLFRAVHRTAPSTHLAADALRPAELRAQGSDPIAGSDPCGSNRINERKHRDVTHRSE